MNVFHRSKFMLLALLLLTAAGGCSQQKSKPSSFTSIEQLDDPACTIAVAVGHQASHIVPKIMTKTKVVELDDLAALTAISQGKVDAFVYGRIQLLVAMANGLSGVKLLPESIGEPTKIAVGISRASKLDGLKDKINAFISELRASGRLDDMYDRWIVKADYSMPDISVPSESNIKLTVGTSGILMPFTYYEGEKLTGYDIELARRFAAWLGAELELKVYDYGGIVAAAATGKIDCIMANLNVTAERAEKIDYSDVLYIDDNVVMVRDN